MNIIVRQLKLLRRLGKSRVLIPPPPPAGARLCCACRKQLAETKYNAAGMCEDCFALAEGKQHRLVVTRQPLRTAY